jgi:hypothetical protein
MCVWPKRCRTVSICPSQSRWAAEVTAEEKNVRVDLAALAEAVEWVDSGFGENRALVSIQTGRIYWRSTDLDEQGLEELPEDIDDPDLYIEVPDKSELDLGRDLVMDFVSAKAPELYDAVRDAFSRRGAYGRYKTLLSQRSLLQDWYAYQASSEERALREWCQDNGLGVAPERLISLSPNRAEG